MDKETLGIRDNSIEPLQSIFSKYINEINRLREEHKLKELQTLNDKLIHLLPDNVKSLSIPIFGKGEPQYITSERAPYEDNQEGQEWSLGNLIAYSINLESNCNNSTED